MHKISKLVCFAAPLNTRQAIRSTSERPSGHESFYSVAGRAARANFDALAACGVNAPLGHDFPYTHSRRFRQNVSHLHVL